MAKRLVDEVVGPKRGRGRPRKDNGSDSGPASVMENGRLGDNAAKRLAGFVDEIETAEYDRAGISDRIKDIYKAAKDAGFENKIIRKVIADRRRDADDLQVEQDMIDIYKQALGMLSDLPLGQAAIVRNVPTRAADALRAAQAHLEGDLPAAV